jgi:hypothetical protein
MRLRMIMIKDWIGQHAIAAIAILLIIPFIAYESFRGIPIKFEQIEGKLLRYGFRPSSHANGEMAWVDLKDGRTVVAAHDVGKPYLAPGAEVILQERTDLWGFRWYTLDHQATAKQAETP